MPESKKSTLSTCTNSAFDGIKHKSMDNNIQKANDENDFNNINPLTEDDLICDEIIPEHDDLPNDSDTYESMELSSPRTLDINDNAFSAYIDDNMQNNIGLRSNRVNINGSTCTAFNNIQQYPQLSDACSSIFKSLATLDVQTFQQAIKYSIFTIFVLLITLYLFPKHLLIILLYILLLVLCLLKYIITPLSSTKITKKTIPIVKKNKQKSIDLKKLELLRKKLLKNTTLAASNSHNNRNIK
ncbi:DiNV CH01M ORF12-like protein [Mauternbach virus]|uniref:DiNV CH01M ORF12-like protein n=1 Tax=Mauternbach virus TaxID=2486603 RepID=A0A3G3E7N5_9VIRU|nr:DiNV CH01M ORF12-like protein [Mauternbach virus]AYP97955.1 DiNV CH01M ORF12-like protein [Mauternbach virus]